jgi:hypothetical protein
MTAKCPICLEGNIVQETLMTEFLYQDVPLRAEYTQQSCDACGSLLQSPDIIRLNMENRALSVKGHCEGGAALPPPVDAADFVASAVRSFAPLLGALQALLHDLDGNAPGIALPPAHAARLRETLEAATAGLDPVQPHFDRWYLGISVEGDMRSNMQRAYTAGAAHHALASAQLSEAEFPQVNLRPNQSADACALYSNFKHIDGDFGAMQRATRHAARSGYLNGFKDGKECASTALAEGTQAQLQSLRAKVSASFALGADLATSLAEKELQGTTYVRRDDVMARVIQWRTQVDGLTPPGANRHGVQPPVSLLAPGPNDAVRHLLASLLAKVNAADLMQAEFNRAITFAQTQGMDIDTFLRCWQHGDWDVLEKEFGYATPTLPSVGSPASPAMSPAAHEAMDELVAQAQQLDMGYN